MSRRKRSVPETQSITSVFIKRSRLDEGKTISVRTTVSFIQGQHYPNNLTCTVTVSNADESVDTASQCTIPITITSAESRPSSSDEMVGDSLKDPATTCAASGISISGGIATDSLGDPNSMCY